MNKTLIAISIIVLILAGAGVAYIAINNPAQRTPKQLANKNSPSQMMEEETGNSITGKLTDLLNMSNVKCEFSTDTDEYSTSGTSYVSNGKVYAESSMQGTDMQADSRVLLTDSNLYFWDPDTKKGSMLSREAMDNMQAMAESYKDSPYNSNSMNLDEEYEYSCVPWMVDNSKFEVPEDVAFEDLSKMLEQAQQMQETMQDEGQMPEVSCDSCAELPSGAKEACMKALNCN